MDSSRKVRGLSVVAGVGVWATLFVAAAALAQGDRTAVTGDAQAGKALWEGPTTSCKNCHGVQGEGGFGPDLAGRAVTFEQFTHAVRKPWGIMPAFVQSQISDKDIRDFFTYFASLKPVAEPGQWRFVPPPGAPPGQAVAIASVGCGQCHGVELDLPRRGAGEMNSDFEWFKRMLYDHTTAMPEQWKAIDGTPTPRIRMGNYSRQRLPESLAQEIWSYMKEIGVLAPVTARLAAPVAAAGGVTYTLDVQNSALPGKGLAADEVTISLVVPVGARVVSTTGAGYQGVRHDDHAKADMAVWSVPRINPKERQAYTMTLSKPGTSADNVKGTIRWENQVPKIGRGQTIDIAAAPLLDPKS